MLAWFLWPRDTSFSDREEAFFAFLIAFVFWVLAEFKESEEVVFRGSTKNDIRLAREIISYASDRFKTLLCDHDHHHGLPPRFLHEANTLTHEHKIGTTFFQDKRVQPYFANFCVELDYFCQYYRMNSSQQKVPGGMLQRIVPPGAELTDELRKEVLETNRLALQSWERLSQLVAKIKDRVPEAFDEPIEYRWFRSKDAYNDLQQRQVARDSIAAVHEMDSPLAERFGTRRNSI